MSTNAYQQVLQLALNLTPEEQLQLIEDLIQNIRQTCLIEKEPSHSILEFEGLGKEVWQAIDVDQYIEEERASWDDEG
jgi:hypothetical protein